MADGTRGTAGRPSLTAQALENGADEDFFERHVQTLLHEVDNVERNILGRWPTTSQLRAWGRIVYRRARNNPGLRAELGISEQELAKR